MKKSCFKGGFCSKAFTLVELLIVVLIIGVLAAVAVPQYQKAVEKSQAAKALLLFKGLVDATKVYEQQAGAWPGSFEALDIAVPGDFQPATLSYSADYWNRQVLANKDWELQLNYNRTTFSGCTHQSIAMIRLTGPYTGTGYIYKVCPSTGAEIQCMETKGFNGTEGSFCRKIINNQASVVGRGVQGVKFNK